MSSWAVQLLTLLAVALGALASFVSTRTLDRSRWRREEALRWDIKRLEAYSEFGIAILDFINIAWRISASHGFPTGAEPLDSEVGLPAMAEAESKLSVQWEKILLLGSPEAIKAADNWRNEAWHLEAFARQSLSDPAEFTKATQDRRAARRRFYSAARADLGIVSGEIPAGTGVADTWWRLRDGQPDSSAKSDRRPLDP
jgi:hypothetical protein